MLFDVLVGRPILVHWTASASIIARHGTNQYISQQNPNSEDVSKESYPKDPCIVGIFTYIWLMFMVNVGKYTIHASYRILKDQHGWAAQELWGQRHSQIPSNPQKEYQPSKLWNFRPTRMRPFTWKHTIRFVFSNSIKEFWCSTKPIQPNWGYTLNSTAYHVFIFFSVTMPLPFFDPANWRTFKSRQRNWLCTDWKVCMLSWNTLGFNAWEDTKVAPASKKDTNSP